MSLRDVLLKVRQDYGALTPTNILVAAQTDDPEYRAELYGRFDWDDQEAGDKWRLHQAHELIRTVRIKLPTGNPVESRDVRAFQAVRGDDIHTFVYEPAEEVALNPLVRQIVLRDMERDWRLLQQRYGHFSEFVELVRREAGNSAA